MPPDTLPRRLLLGGLAACAAGPALATNSAAANNLPEATALPTPATPNARPWTRQAYLTAMAASARPVTLDEARFAALQATKPKALQAIASALTRRFGEPDPAVLAAFAAVPREYFLYNYQRKQAGQSPAAMAADSSWPLGFGAALPDALICAAMTQLLAPRPGDSALEIGTGSGFQSALLSRMVGHVDTLEIVPELGTAVQKLFAPLGYANITPRIGDGYGGWPGKIGFDLIIVTCAAPYVPPALLAQLKPGGRMVIPLYRRAARRQALYFYHKDATGKLHASREMRCYFEPMTGRITTAPMPREGAG